jgi:hypothetical protein
MSTETPTVLAKTKIAELLNGESLREFTVPEITAYVQGNLEIEITAGVIAGALHSMSEAKQIRKVSRGLYSSIQSDDVLTSEVVAILEDAAQKIRLASSNIDIFSLQDFDLKKIARIKRVLSGIDDLLDVLADKTQETHG